MMAEGRRASLVSFALLLVACDPGGEGEAPAPTPAKAPASPEATKAAPPKVAAPPEAPRDPPPQPPPAAPEKEANVEEPPAQPAPSPTLEEKYPGSKPWTTSVKDGVAPVRIIVPLDRTADADGKTYHWGIEAIVSDGKQLWIAEESFVRGRSAKEMRQPGARVTRWPLTPGEPTELTKGLQPEPKVLVRVRDQLVFAAYDVMGDELIVSKAPLAGGPFEKVETFPADSFVRLSDDGKRLEILEHRVALDPITGKKKKLSEEESAYRSTKPLEKLLAGCRDRGSSEKALGLRRFGDHLFWRTPDEVRTDMFKISKGAQGRVRHCRLKDGHTETLAHIQARWLGGHFDWDGQTLLFSLDGGVFAVNPP